MRHSIQTFARNAIKSRSISTLCRPLNSGISAAQTVQTIRAQLNSVQAARPFATTPAQQKPDFNDPKYKKYVNLKPGTKIVVLGFGAIGTGVLPLLMRHIGMKPDQLVVIANQFDEKARAHAANYGVQLITEKLTKTDYLPALQRHVKSGDFLVNVSVDVSSVALVEHCANVGALYIDTCNEPWAGGYSDPNATAAARSNYAFREQALELRKKLKKDGPTALITHGANPGIVSHFVKQALINIAKDTNFNIAKKPTTSAEWATLARDLGIKTIHIAERDTQASDVIKHDGEFVNTWSIEGYVEEGKQPAELGWGTHEKEFPIDGARHDNGCDAAIYLNRPGAVTKVRTWTPASGNFHGHCITHTEAISIADYFTLKNGSEVVYRPTVNFAYHASNDAMASLNEVAGREWIRHDVERIMVDEIRSGRDELGVLLMGHKKNAYWYGSDLNIDQVRAIVPNNNATSLQVCTSVLSGAVWCLENPNRGLVEPEEVEEYERILEIAKHYLGTVHGKYTDWTPLHRRGLLFPEDLDKEDPFQFKNFRVL